MSSIIRAEAIRATQHPRNHPMDASRVRITASLGDQVGLTKLGIHKATLAPNMISTVEHWHECDDEWFFILKGSATLLGEEEQLVQEGDFIGFPAGKKAPHAFRASEEGLEYLVGGSREPIDMTHYPGIATALLVNRSKGTETVLKESDVRITVAQ